MIIEISDDVAQYVDYITKTCCNNWEQGFRKLHGELQRAVDEARRKQIGTEAMDLRNEIESIMAIRTSEIRDVASRLDAVYRRCNHEFVPTVLNPVIDLPKRKEQCKICGMIAIRDSEPL